MSCSGYFETLLQRSEEESFKNQVLQDIQQLKTRLSRKLQSLQVKGDFRNDNHENNEINGKLEKLEKITARMTELLEVSN